MPVEPFKLLVGAEWNEQLNSENPCTLSRESGAERSCAENPLPVRASNVALGSEIIWIARIWAPSAAIVASGLIATDPETAVEGENVPKAAGVDWRAAETLSAAASNVEASGAGFQAAELPLAEVRLKSAVGLALNGAAIRSAPTMASAELGAEESELESVPAPEKLPAA